MNHYPVYYHLSILFVFVGRLKAFGNKLQTSYFRAPNEKNIKGELDAEKHDLHTLRIRKTRYCENYIENIYKELLRHIAQIIYFHKIFQKAR